MKRFFIASLFLVLAACENESSDVTAPVAKETSKAGPYNVAFDASNNYSHQFNMDINQAEGAVDYYVSLPKDTEITLLSTKLKVQGCNAANVAHSMYWISDLSKSAGQAIAANMTFRASAAVKGSVRHVIRGLSGCTNVDLSMTLKAATVTMPSCKESADKDCRVEIYCKEKGPYSTFAEAEIWNESWGPSLRMYMNHGDNTRALMSAETATKTEFSTTSWMYRGKYTSLGVFTTSGQGVFSQSFGGGNPTTIDMECKTYIAK